MVGNVFTRIGVRIQVTGTPITLEWTTYAGGTYDPGSNATVGGTASIVQSGVIGLVHTSEAKSELRQFVEIAVGDIIVDFPPTLNLEGLEGLYFILPDGRRYQQKMIDEKLTRAWDLIIAGNPTVRTMLLKTAT